MMKVARARRSIADGWFRIAGAEKFCHRVNRRHFDRAFETLAALKNTQDIGFHEETGIVESRIYKKPIHNLRKN
jgi:hypothetical protein